jgi:transglutaminase-like putative cysteine protease
MRIQVSHQTTLRYEQPATGVIQMVRLTPRNHNGQYVVDWRIDVSENCEIRQHEDAFGNITHVLTADGAISELRIGVDGDVETQDMHGVVAGAIERFPPRLFLRETPLTQADAAIADFANAMWAAAGGDVLGTLHGLLDRLYETMKLDAKAALTPPPAATAFAQQRGVSQDLTHVFIAAARSLDIPARYIGGHFRADGVVEQESAHAWAEAFVPDLGWVGFDPANGFCPTDAHVRVAVGLDCLGAAPVRGSKSGGAGDEAVDVSIRVSQDGGQRQSQS